MELTHLWTPVRERWRRTHREPAIRMSTKAARALTARERGCKLRRQPLRAIIWERWGGPLRVFPAQHGSPFVIYGNISYFTVTAQIGQTQCIDTLIDHGALGVRRPRNVVRDIPTTAPMNAKSLQATSWYGEGSHTKICQRQWQLFCQREA